MGWPGPRTVCIRYFYGVFWILANPSCIKIGTLCRSHVGETFSQAIFLAGNYLTCGVYDVFWILANPSCIKIGTLCRSHIGETFSQAMFLAGIYLTCGVYGVFWILANPSCIKIGSHNAVGWSLLSTNRSKLVLKGEQFAG